MITSIMLAESFLYCWNVSCWYLESSTSPLRKSWRRSWYHDIVKSRIKHRHKWWYPQFSSISRWDFPWNKSSSYWRTPMAMACYGYAPHLGSIKKSMLLEPAQGTTSICLKGVGAPATGRWWIGTTTEPTSNAVQKHLQSRLHLLVFTQLKQKPSLSKCLSPIIPGFIYYRTHFKPPVFKWLKFQKLPGGTSPSGPGRFNTSKFVKFFLDHLGSLEPERTDQKNPLMMMFWGRFRLSKRHHQTNLWIVLVTKKLLFPQLPSVGFGEGLQNMYLGLQSKLPGPMGPMPISGVDRFPCTFGMISIRWGGIPLSHQKP